MHAKAMFLLGIPLLVLAACGDPVGPGSDTITQLPRALTLAEQAVIRDGNAFGLELMRQVAARDARPNIVLSPLSASMALGMTLNGAAGTTFDAMRSTLGFPGLTQEQINEAYRGLLALLVDLDPQVRFDIANSVWANRDTPFHEAFLQAVRAAFGARVESRDFANPSTLTAINDWVKQNTDGLIEKILDDLDPEMVAILINAIYFDGAWTSRFDPSKTAREEFRREDGRSVQVDMMKMSEGKFPMGGGSDWSAIELPYGGEAFSMVVILPSGATTARDFLRRLDAARWQEITSGLSSRELDMLSIPKFTLAYDTYLNDALKAMGMGVAFRPGADFRRMSPIGDRLCIDFVRQKTFIEVDERGTKAAAVTAVGMRPTSFNGLVVDRPFVFAIRERLSGTLLFVGLVGDPTVREMDPPSLASDCR